MKTIAITAGHSNTDSGAVGIGGRKESSITLEMRNLVAALLTKAVVPYVTDGVGSDNQPLTVAIAKAKTAQFAVEFHCNAATATAKGVEVLAGPNHVKEAQALARAVADALGTVLRGDKGYKPEDSGQHSKLGFISKGNGVILELFFVTNATELAAWDAKKQQVAAAVAAVLINISKGTL